VSLFSLSLFLSAAFRIWTSLQKLYSNCFWLVNSVGEKENTIQPPFLCFSHLHFWLYFTIYAITYLFLKMEWMVNKEKKRSLLSTFFIDSEGRVSFVNVPVRDQNLVVRGRNTVWFVLCFLLVLKKIKIKNQVANKNWVVFFILKEKWLKVELKLI